MRRPASTRPQYVCSGFRFDESVYKGIRLQNRCFRCSGSKVTGFFLSAETRGSPTPPCRPCLAPPCFALPGPPLCAAAPRRCAPLRPAASRPWCFRVLDSTVTFTETIGRRSTGLQRGTKNGRRSTDTPIVNCALSLVYIEVSLFVLLKRRPYVAVVFVFLEVLRNDKNYLAESRCVDLPRPRPALTASPCRAVLRFAPIRLAPPGPVPC